MTYDGNHHYTYDAENRIVQVDGGAAATYVYDAEGRRAEKQAPGWSDYIHDLSGNKVAEVYATGWGPGYVYLGGNLMAQYSNGTTYFVHTDHLGSARLLTAEGPSTRIQSSGGTSLWKYYISGVCPTVSGVTYTISVMVKNQGTAAVQIGGNIVNGPVIAPGVTQQVSFTEAGNGTSCAQLGFVTLRTGDSIDVLAFAPSITASTAPSTNLIASGNQNFSGWAAYLGSSVTLTQAQPPLVLDSLDYLPYGEQIAGDTGTTHKFTGKERDSESGLDEFGARYYSSSMGRFMIPDWSDRPAAVPYANIGNPQTLNLYSYVQNDPTSFIDPDGHCWSWAQFFCNTGQRIRNEFEGYGFHTDSQVEQNLHNAHTWLREHGVTAEQQENMTDKQVLSVANAAQHNQTSVIADRVLFTIQIVSSLPGTLPGSKPDWGKNRFVKELHDRGFVYDGPTNSGDGLMYKNPTTGEEVRVMPNPNRTPYRGEPAAKFENDNYYRYRSGPDQPWGPHTTLPDK